MSQQYIFITGPFVGHVIDGDGRWRENFQCESFYTKGTFCEETEDELGELFLDWLEEQGLFSHTFSDPERIPDRWEEWIQTWEVAPL